MKKRKRKYKSAITQRIWKSARKLGVIFLILIFSVGIYFMSGTNAGFFDEEKSEGNTLNAGTLDATAAQTSFAYTTGTAPMESGDAITQAVNFENDGSLAFQYKVKYLNVDGGDLCDAMLLTAKKDSTVIYNKLPLKDFDTGNMILPAPPVTADTPILDPTQSDDWTFILELPDNPDQTLENETCNFNFKFIAWQTDFTDKTLGFWDEELADPSVDGIEIETGEWVGPGDVVINEIMWMGSDGSTADEWIELKNMTGEEINLSNWDIQYAGTGASGHIEISNGYSIKPNGYFLIINNKWDETAINLSEDLDKNEGYTHVAGMNLDNDGEPLILKDKNGNIIDTAWKYAAWPAGINGTLKQSMERNDIPGDGTLAGSWHTCVSGAANDGTYWDTADGNNYGTPGAANLSPVVMNEIMFNPSDGDKEWVELYNISDEDIDVSGWYFKNSNEDKIVISEENSDNNGNLDDEGETKVLSQERLVVYFDEGYFDNKEDEIWLYNDMGTPDDEDDDVREDAYKYKDADVFPEDKTFSRIPDGVGIWIDPEATPGEENKLSDEEIEIWRLYTYDKCFSEDGKLNKKSKEEICAPEFLEYLGMIDKIDGNKVDAEIEFEILGLKIKEEEKKLAALLAETEEIPEEQNIPIDGESPAITPEPASGTDETDVSETAVPEKNNQTETDASDNVDKTDTSEPEKEIEAKTEPEPEEEKPDNTIKDETNGQI